MSACYVTNAVLGTGNMSVNRAKNSAFLMLTLGQEMERKTTEMLPELRGLIIYVGKQVEPTGSRGQ